MKKLKRMKSIISWVCQPCGTKFGRHRTTASTWHIGQCDICDKTQPVTEGRDFGVYGIDNSPFPPRQDGGTAAACGRETTG